MSNVTAVLKPEAHAEKIDIGLDAAYRKEMAGLLTGILEDTYRMTVKSHIYHWNVVGPMFNTLHLMFETQYNELALAVDLIAERIRALGAKAPGSYSEFAQLTSMSEGVSTRSAAEMIADLVAGQEAVVRTARALFPVVEEAHEEPTADLLTQRMQIHEKTAWMLRSLLDE